MDFVAAVEQEAREIVGDTSDREYVARRSAAGTMPRLNRVFEEIQHTEHRIPAEGATVLGGEGEESCGGECHRGSRN